MTQSNITIGSKIVANGATMVVTKITDKAYIGYSEYKGKNVGECRMQKDMLTNPHYMNGIAILA